MQKKNCYIVSEKNTQKLNVFPGNFLESLGGQLITDPEHCFSIKFSKACEERRHKSYRFCYLKALFNVRSPDSLCIRPQGLLQHGNIKGTLIHFCLKGNSKHRSQKIVSCNRVALQVHNSLLQLSIIFRLFLYTVGNIRHRNIWIKICTL